MALRMGLIGKKIGMTQVFDKSGERIPVTAIVTGPCVVTAKLTPDKNKYAAIQLGFEEKKAERTNRPDAGRFRKADVSPQTLVQEIRIPEADLEKYEIGQVIKAEEVFEAGNAVDVSGTTRGKGFQGVIKRHHMSGAATDSHGTHEYFRHGGSLGCRLTPGRVFKGKKMPGHMGNVKVTVQNLEVVQVLPEENLVLIRGGVPGGKNTFVTIKKAVKIEQYKRRRKGEGAAEKSKNPMKASKAAAGK